jgi:hypothetical protein
MERGLGVTLLQFRYAGGRRGVRTRCTRFRPRRWRQGAFAAVLAFVLAGGTDVTVLTVTPQSAIAEPCGNGNC